MPESWSPFVRSVPDPLKGLIELTLDLRFSWSHTADHIWKQMDPELWSLTHNPWLILQTVADSKLRSLAEDPSFCETVQSLISAERTFRETPRWYQKTHGDNPLTAVAYFSMEFGISESLPIYSGGLGNVAGDHLKAANDLGVPLVGVGILYQYGYFRQALAADGAQVALYPTNNTAELPVLPVRNGQGDWLRLPLDIPGHGLWIRVWEARIGRVRLYLLDSNDPANFPVDRCITTELYGGGPEERLMQEILLGIGGYRVLRAVGIRPEVCHINEGHGAFVVLERARTFMEDHQTDFWAALAATRAGNLFTTHTPVDAGFDRFDPGLIERYLGGYCASLGITPNELLSLGRRVQNDPQKPFNMAYLAIRGSGAINGVSQLHGAVSRKLFAPLFPGWPVAEAPIGQVTNGIHVPTWSSDDADALWKGACGKGVWVSDLHGVEEKFRSVSDEALWSLRGKQRQRLVTYARAFYARRLAATSTRSMREVQEEAQHLFDPNALTLGFARRFVSYKRPDLLLRDPDRLVRMLTSPHYPVQIVIAGKAHPQDQAGRDMVKAWVRFVQRADVRRRAIFIGDYDMLVAERLVQGVDVWINTPRRPWEASGTSGMKVLANGGLNLSELDGWWAEAYRDDVGWALGDGQEHDLSWDGVESDALYSLLEQQIIPEFYHRDAEGLPRQWIARMRESMARLTPQYSANRMIREYTENYYVPCAERYRVRAADNGALGLALFEWNTELGRHWSSVHFGDVEVETQGDYHVFRVPVYLGELDPETVSIQLYADPIEGEPAVCQPMTRAHPFTGSANGFLSTGRVPAHRPVDHYTPRAVPFHPQALVPLEAGHILWQG
ncbi:MAG TPA: alpha-glucan family phosphorylase [Methylococcaceae bacterium]|nr:alpha-glucan family phosphorylase [Methylococcaceae bacterium]